MFNRSAPNVRGTPAHDRWVWGMAFDQIPVTLRTLPSVPELLIQADTAESPGTCDLNPNYG
jgi:hypothetical protein